jgi:hypothetical protein
MFDESVENEFVGFSGGNEDRVRSVAWLGLESKVSVDMKLKQRLHPAV